MTNLSEPINPAPNATPSGWTSPGDGPPKSGPPKPWWKKPWGIAAIVIVILVALSAFGAAIGGGQTASTASPAPSQVAGEASQPPTATATAEASPSAPSSTPSAEPSTEATPAPTVAPTPAPPTPAPPTAAPAILKAAGRGDKVVKLTAQDEPTVARITGKGSGNFAVISYVGSDYNDLLVNEIGSYGGNVYVAAGVTRLKVTSSGSWTIEVRPITSARAWDGTTALSGKGDAVVLLSGGASGITTIKDKGRSNFAVVAYTPDGEYLDLLVNEIGSYTGEVLLPDADPMVLTLHAVGGTWSMSAVTQ